MVWNSSMMNLKTIPKKEKSKNKTKQKITEHKYISGKMAFYIYLYTNLITK